MIGRVIESFFSNTYAGEMVISDNSPEKESHNFIERNYSSLINEGKLKYITFPENPGYGISQNLCFLNRTGKATYHVILNPDVCFASDTFKKIIEYMESDSQIAQVMPRIEDASGEVQYLCKRLPTPLDVFVRRFIKIKHCNDRITYEYENRNFSYDKPLNVPYLSGCFMFLRSAVFESIGMFDERFFMYPEDIDLTRRIHRIFKTMYFPDAVVVHDHARDSYKNTKMVIIHAVNMIKYFNKWGWFHDPERRNMNEKLKKEIQNGFQYSRCSHE